MTKLGPLQRCTLTCGRDPDEARAVRRTCGQQRRTVYGPDQITKLDRGFSFQFSRFSHHPGLQVFQHEEVKRGHCTY